jgi:hypothetical protein
LILLLSSITNKIVKEDTFHEKARRVAGWMRWLWGVGKGWISEVDLFSKKWLCFHRVIGKNGSG